jgi:hypothetical protein
MPSTLQMAGPLTPADDAVIAGVRRSRLSIHLSTPRVRRWLLVQLVSVPVHANNKEPNADNASLAPAHAPAHAHLGRLLDDYITNQTIRRVI